MKPSRSLRECCPLGHSCSMPPVRRNGCGGSGRGRCGGLAVLAAYTGFAAIVGALLAGMPLSENTGRRVHDLARGVGELLGLTMGFTKQNVYSVAVVMSLATTIVAPVLIRLAFKDLPGSSGNDAEQIYRMG